MFISIYLSPVLAKDKLLKIALSDLGKDKTDNFSNSDLISLIDIIINDKNYLLYYCYKNKLSYRFIYQTTYYNYCSSRPQ